MEPTPDHFEKLFLEATRSWDLERLYADIETVSGKLLKPSEKACLRGLLCRYRPGQIAFQFSWTSGTLRVELNKGLYRHIEALTERSPNTLRWESVGEWLSDYHLSEERPSVDPAIASKLAFIDWGEAPDVPIFFGRQNELAELEQWVSGDRCRLVAVWGMGGIGKTALSVKLVERLHGHFTHLIWRSLRHVQPIEEFVLDLLPLLSHAGSRFDLSGLIDAFRKHRCLLVLDDFETILRDGELVGPYRQGSEGYSELLQRVGGERHQSCLLLISREQPKEIAVMQGENLPIRSFKLSGMKKDGARELLRARGFTGSEGGLDELIQQYRGNPSALKIVSGTIQELFNGNISEFLKQTTLALGDILLSLLYSQFERLSHAEKDVLYWLALKRRPVSLAELRDDMGLPSASEIINALESLRWRSLMEKVTEDRDVRFVLEPVVMKYVNKKFVEEVCLEVEAIVRTKSLSKARLLRSHLLVEDRAPESIRAVQIRLMLKPVKDRLAALLADDELAFDRLSELLDNSQLRIGEGHPYVETNMALLGLWVSS